MSSDPLTVMSYSHETKRLLCFGYLLEGTETFSGGNWVTDLEVVGTSIYFSCQQVILIRTLWTHYFLYNILEEILDWYILEHLWWPLSCRGSPAWRTEQTQCRTLCLCRAELRTHRKTRTLAANRHIYIIPLTEMCRLWFMIKGLLLSKILSVFVFSRLYS